MKVYFIGGIGADRRLFTHVRLPRDFESEYLDWIPFKEGEGIQEYALRLAEAIDTSRPFVLIGLSLGGIMAVEIARQFPPVCTIILGSIPLSAQLPAYFKMARKLRLPELVSGSFIKRSAIFKRMFTRESRADKLLIRQMIRDADAAFIKWAIQAVLDWHNDVVPTPFWHLHGTRDEMFPIWLTRPTHIIPRGGHLLVMTHAREVNDLLGDILRPYGLLPS